MSFTSWSFPVFAAVIFFLYYFPPLRKLQVVTLVASSFFFYGYGNHNLLPLLLFSIGSTYVCLVLALTGRKAWMWSGIWLNLAVLVFFKYKFLFIEAGRPVGTGFSTFDALMALPLPIGISFFVFHNISMLVDFTKTEKSITRPSLKDAFLYLIFFPQLVSGPIARASGFFPQIRPKYLHDVRFIEATKWIVLGYFMKLFCANNLNQFTTHMDSPLYQSLSGLDAIILLFLYSFQIYADFFGYTAIAVGLAILFGYRLPVNFNLPYMSDSFSSFWNRWHISLSTWLRKYLYIPLGGNRKGKVRTYLNLMIVMGLGGLWHGAGLSYLIWGLIHGLFLVIERPFLALREKIEPTMSGWSSLAVRSVSVLLVFLCVSWAWLFFKLPHFGDAVGYMNVIVSKPLILGFHENFYVLAAVYSLPVVTQHLFARTAHHSWFKRLEAPFYATLAFLAIVEAGPDAAFIYFQF